MATGHEVKFYADISRISKALEKQADLAELQYLEGLSEMTWDAHRVRSSITGLAARIAVLQGKLWPGIK